jgi:ketosteroid isomerase-like protein
MPAISPDQVRAEVQRFWNSFIKKLAAEFEAMYFPNAAIFASTVPRTELARLTVTRRVRQFFGPKSAAQVEIGPIDVQLIGNIAVASYSYKFRGTEVKNDGNAVEHEIPTGRATQIFQLDDAGKLRILHEHLSSGEPPKADTTVEI